MANVQMSICGYIVLIFVCWFSLIGQGAQISEFGHRVPFSEVIGAQKSYQ